MARGISKKGLTIEIVSTPLEEHVPVCYTVVGTQDWLNGSFESGALSDASIVNVTDPACLAPILEWLDKRKTHGVDTEATGEGDRSGLDPWRRGSRLLLFQIGNEERVYVVEPQLVPHFKPHLQNPTYTHLIQNGVFDWKYLYHQYNIHINNIYDPMLAEQLLTSGKTGYKVGLADMARRYEPYRLVNKSVRSEFFNFNGKFSKSMVYYAARDIVLMFPIMREQQVALSKWHMEQVAQDEFNLIPVTGSMELGGVFINTDVLRLALTYWKREQERLEATILSVYDGGMKKLNKNERFLLPEMSMVFDVNSPAQKLKAIRELGFKLDDVRRDTLEEMNEQSSHPIFPLLARYSEVMKVVSTYGEGLISKIDPISGMLHPDFHQLGSGDLELAQGAKKGTIATGRFSSDFQQIPKAKDLFDEVTDTAELKSVTNQFGNKIKELLKEL